MLFESFVDRDLGHASYIFGDEVSGEVAVVDPRRDIDEYIEFIEENKLNVKYILNTHTHADYIGGHLELKNYFKNVQNVFSSNVPCEFEFQPADDNNELYLGEKNQNIHTKNSRAYTILYKFSF